MKSYSNVDLSCPECGSSEDFNPECPICTRTKEGADRHRLRMENDVKQIGFSAKLTGQPDKNGWIDTITLPPDKWGGLSDHCLVSIIDYPKPKILIASYCFVRNGWRTPMGPIDGVTHWRPMPEGPE